MASCATLKRNQSRCSRRKIGSASGMWQFTPAASSSSCLPYRVHFRISKSWGTSYQCMFLPSSALTFSILNSCMPTASWTDSFTDRFSANRTAYFSTGIGGPNLFRPIHPRRHDKRLVSYSQDQLLSFSLQSIMLGIFFFITCYIEKLYWSLCFGDDEVSLVEFRWQND